MVIGCKNSSYKVEKMPPAKYCEKTICYTERLTLVLLGWSVGTSRAPLEKTEGTDETYKFNNEEQSAEYSHGSWLVSHLQVLNEWI